MSPEHWVAQLVAARAAKKQADADEKQALLMLQPTFDKLFPDKVGAVVIGNTSVESKLLREQVSSDDPYATAEWMHASGQDILIKTAFSSVKLREIGAVNSDSRVLWEGEAIPGLVVSNVYGISTKPA